MNFDEVKTHLLSRSTLYERVILPQKCLKRNDTTSLIWVLPDTEHVQESLRNHYRLGSAIHLLYNRSQNNEQSVLKSYLICFRPRMHLNYAFRFRLPQNFIFRLIWCYIIIHFSVPTNDVEAPSEPRYITTDQTVQGLGLNILGGNATGIFVCDVKSPGHDLGIRTGDQILEVGIIINGHCCR